MPGTAIVTIGEKQWAVDVAVSPEELTAGLGGVASIPAYTGMLFDLGSEQTVQVTTEPMLFNIDVIFISEALEVVDLVENVAPGYLLTEDTPVRYFLEVNAGEAEAIEAGDSVEITDYQYTPPSAISQWMPTIIGVSILGFVGAMVGGVASGMFGHHSSPERKQGNQKPTRSDVEVGAWQERDRLGIWITDIRTDKVIAQWWDDDAREMFEQGFFKPGVPTYSWEKPGREFVDSVLDYAESVGILAKREEIHHSNPEKKLDKRLELAGPGKGTTVTCPICGDVIEIPEWDKVSRSEALRKHLEKVKHEPEHHSSSTSPGSKEKVWFIGGCKVVDGLCHTHGYSVSKTVRCPKSPLTDEEWTVAWELAEAAFPEGMSNPWVNGWWPETLEEAEKTVWMYQMKMRHAVDMFRESQRKAVENYERSANKAIYNYRQYVMKEYEKGKALKVVA